MQFGLGQQTSGGKFDWTNVHRHMTGRWPALTPGQTNKYAELVMAQLSEPATDKPYFTDGISKKDILQHYELNKVPRAVNWYNTYMHTTVGRGICELKLRCFPVGACASESQAHCRSQQTLKREPASLALASKTGQFSL